MARLVRLGIVVVISVLLVLFLFSNYELLTQTFPDFRFGIGRFAHHLPQARLVYLLFGFFVGGFLITWLYGFIDIGLKARETRKLRSRVRELEAELARAKAAEPPAFETERLGREPASAPTGSTGEDEREPSSRS